MYPSLRIAVEKMVGLSESIQERIAHLRNAPVLKVPILVYHHIDSMIDRSNNVKLYVHNRLFADEMKYLADNGYTTITLDDLKVYFTEGKKVLTKSVILTFDDGYHDFYTKAFPIIEKYHLKATIFIATAWLDRPNYLSLDQLQKLLKSSFITIGSHTINHPDLTKLSHKEVDDELKTSKKYLEEKLGIKITSFAYPFGSYNKRMLIKVKEAGYENAVTTKYGRFHMRKDLFALKRIRLGPNLSLSDFIRRVNN